MFVPITVKDVIYIFLYLWNLFFSPIKGLRVIPFFEKKFEEVLENFLRVNFVLSIAAQWLNIRLQLIGVIIATSLAAIAVICTVSGILPTSGAQLGLALAYSLSIVNNLNGLVSSLAETEQVT